MRVINAKKKLVDKYVSLHVIKLVRFGYLSKKTRRTMIWDQKTETKKYFA